MGDLRAEYERERISNQIAPCVNIFGETSTCTSKQLETRYLCGTDIGCQVYQIVGKDFDEHYFYSLSSAGCVLSFSLNKSACETHKQGADKIAKGIKASAHNEALQTYTYGKSCLDENLSDCSNLKKQTDYQARLGRSIVNGTINTVSTCGGAMYDSAFNGQLATNQQAFSCLDTAGMVMGARAGLAGGGAKGAGSSLTKAARTQGQFYKEAIRIRKELGLLPNQQKGLFKTNIGIADVNIKGLPTQTLKSISEDAFAQPGFVTESSNQVFKTIADGQNPFPRSFDTEAKLLTNIDQQLKGNTSASGSVRLFTERPMCASCSGVVDQFQTKYPNVNLEVIQGQGRNYNYPNN